MLYGRMIQHSNASVSQNDFGGTIWHPNELAATSPRLESSPAFSMWREFKHRVTRRHVSVLNCHVLHISAANTVLELRYDVCERSTVSHLTALTCRRGERGLFCLVFCFFFWVFSEKLRRIYRILKSPGGANVIGLFYINCFQGNMPKSP